MKPKSNRNSRKSRNSRPKTRRPKLKRRKTRTRKGGTCQDTNQRAYDYMMSYPHPK